MVSSRQNREKQVRLTIFDNEPMARLAEQRLRQEGIPCFTRSLQGGPGAWGSAYTLPHALYVYQADVTRARETLNLAPAEVVERERTARVRAHRSVPDSTAMRIIAAVLVFGLVAFLLVRLIR